MRSHTFTGFNSKPVRLTGLPFGPSSPGGPLAPAGPAAPGGPASPFSPLSPLGPYSDEVFLMSTSKEAEFFLFCFFQSALHSVEGKTDIGSNGDLGLFHRGQQP